MVLPSRCGRLEHGARTESTLARHMRLAPPSTFATTAPTLWSPATALNAPAAVETAAAATTAAYGLPARMPAPVKPTVAATDGARATATAPPPTATARASRAGTATRCRKTRRRAEDTFFQY